MSAKEELTILHSLSSKIEILIYTVPREGDPRSKDGRELGHSPQSKQVAVCSFMTCWHSGQTCFLSLKVVKINGMQENGIQTPEKHIPTQHKSTNRKVIDRQQEKEKFHSEIEQE